MAKTETIYICSECGHETKKWLGKCPGCGTFNTFMEEIAGKRPKGGASVSSRPAGKVETLNQITVGQDHRRPTRIDELDRVLSGGIVDGSLTLIGGEPGIGKSTILLQLCQNMGGAGDTVLYVSGEESGKQIKSRADRLGVTTSNLLFMPETDLDAIEAAIIKHKPELVIIDSIQTMTDAEIASSPGSVTQVREGTARFMRLSKNLGIPVILVGHVTKDGNIAGPRILEHMVDTVLYFEGEKSAVYRIIRAVKNRFGATNEIGVFEMTEGGLAGIANPSEYMLSGRPLNVPGTAVTCAAEGTRPLLTEIQALVCPTAFGTPRRTTSGADFNRAVMLMAVLEKRAGLRLGDHDAYINIAGGMKITEPAIDAAIAAAVASSFRNKKIDPYTLIFGEVGLTGEIRAVALAERRINEAAKLGFKRCVLPKANLKGLKAPEGIEVVGAENMFDILEIMG